MNKIDKSKQNEISKLIDAIDWLNNFQQLTINIIAKLAEGNDKVITACRRQLVQEGTGKWAGEQKTVNQKPKRQESEKYESSKHLK